jgi:GET complex subunit GET2
LKPQAKGQHGDPDEVDISEHFYVPRTTPRPAGAGTPPTDPNNISEAQLRQIMLGYENQTGGMPPNPFAGAGGGMPGGEEDPLMKMLAQMMGPGGAGPGFPGFPPNGSGAAGAGPAFPGMPQPPPSQAQTDPYATIFRLIHALLAIGLGLYIALGTAFSGTKIERERAEVAFSRGATTSGPSGVVGDELGKRQLFFWVFATAEAVLLTTRFFLDKGKVQQKGWLWSAASFLPEPIRGYVAVVLRYGQIFGTVRTDILVCVFVLGTCAWVRGT